MATSPISLIYAVIYPVLAADIPTLEYLGDQAIPRDENGRTYSWNGLAYVIGEAAEVGVQDSLDPPRADVAPSVRVLAESIGQVPGLLSSTAQTSALVQQQAVLIETMQAQILRLQAAVLPPGSGALTLTAPTMTGTLGVGLPLTLVSGTVGNGTAVNTAWTIRRAGTIVATPMSASYTPVTADGGTTLTVTQTVTNAAGQVTSATSIGYGIPAAPAVPVVITPPQITGSAIAGQTLGVTRGTYTNSSGITFVANSWRNGSTVLGTSSTLLITEAMAGLTIDFYETPHNSAGDGVPTRAAASVIVAGGTTPVCIVKPGWEATSTFAVGGVGTPNPGEWSGNPDPTLDVWGYLRDGVVITNAAGVPVTGAPYTFVQADQDKTVTPTLSRRNGGSSPSPMVVGSGEFISAGTGGVVISPTPTSSIGTITAAALTSTSAGSIGYHLTPNAAGVVDRTSGYAISHAPVGGALADHGAVLGSISFTSGTPTPSGTVTTGLKTAWGVNGRGITFTFDVPAGSTTPKVSVSGYNCIAAITAVLADGSATPASFNVDAGSGASVDRVVSIPVTAAAPTQLIVTITQGNFYTSGNGDLHFQGAWF